jgi:hypothetical protein
LQLLRAGTSDSSHIFRETMISAMQIQSKILP